MGCITRQSMLLRDLGEVLQDVLNRELEIHSRVGIALSRDLLIVLDLFQELVLQHTGLR